jgi:hypothetical protein
MASEEDDGRAPHSGPQGFLYYQAVLPNEPHIQYKAGWAIWALARQELAGGREGFDLHPERADEAS